MSDHKNKIASKLKAFVDHPVTKLIKGIALILIGLADASRTIETDLNPWHLHVGHGLVLIGVFGILDALPNVLDGLESGVRFLERREKIDRGGERDGKP